MCDSSSDRLTVVIPTAGQCPLLARTIQSLATCDRPPSFVRAIVVENGPQGPASQVVDDCADLIPIEYRHVERANKSNALNVVFRTLNKEELVYLVDDDVRFAPNVLWDYARAAEGKRGGYVFGGPLKIDSTGTPPQDWLEFLPPSMKGWESTPAEAKANARFLGANWAVFVGDVLQAGGFDVRFGPGSPMNATGQEWNMQRVLQQHGVEFVYLPDAVVWHHVDFSRFTPNFLMQRKFRGGIESGILAADYFVHCPTFRNRIYPPLLRGRVRLLRASLLACLARLTGNTTKRLKHELAANHARGMLNSFPKALAELKKQASEA